MTDEGERAVARERLERLVLLKWQASATSYPSLILILRAWQLLCESEVFCEKLQNFAQIHLLSDLFCGQAGEV